MSAFIDSVHTTSGPGAGWTNVTRPSWAGTGVDVIKFAIGVSHGSASAVGTVIEL